MNEQLRFLKKIADTDSKMERAEKETGRADFNSEFGRNTDNFTEQFVFSQFLDVEKKFQLPQTDTPQQRERD